LLIIEKVGKLYQEIRLFFQERQDEKTIFQFADGVTHLFGSFTGGLFQKRCGESAKENKAGLYNQRGIGFLGFHTQRM
jgi:hypothetical protein